MKNRFKHIIIATLCIIFTQEVTAQQFPLIKKHAYTTDSVFTPPKRPWLAAGEAIGANLFIWAADRYVAKADFAYINGSTIKQNFKTGPIWDTDMFSTNLFAHPYHGSLYFNAARSNGLNFWQSAPYTLGGSLMWEFFMENEPPSTNDIISTSFGGIALGEATYRLSDLFIDERTSGAERVGREILTGLVSPMRGINRLITGQSWKHGRSKGRAFKNVPVSFIVSAGSRYMSSQESPKSGSLGLNLLFRLDYGNPFNDTYYSPYEWFQMRGSFEFLSSQPLINQFNAIGVLWGKEVYAEKNRNIMFGIFQHFDYYDSETTRKSSAERVPYRISEAVAGGAGLIYYHRATPEHKVDVFGELFLNGVGLGASVSDYYKVGNRDYNMGSGYSVKMYSGVTYNKRWSFLLSSENYHIYTWKGYDPDLDLDTVDPNHFNVQGDHSNARLTLLTSKFVYYSEKKWNIALTSRYYQRHTHYRYYDRVVSSNFDVMLSCGMDI